jgi:hypothetical protein
VCFCCVEDDGVGWMEGSDDTPTDRGETDFGGQRNGVWGLELEGIRVRYITLHSKLSG